MQLLSIHSHHNNWTPIDSGLGWIAVRSNNILAVFVHVPNRIASNKSACTAFYNEIKQKTLQDKDGGVIDIIIGDTNQPSKNFSPEVVSAAMSAQFKDGHSGNTKPCDVWPPSQITHKGTNSADSKKFDVAIYNSATVKNVEVKYLSQLAASNRRTGAYTDHMGMLVKVEPK